MKDLDVGFALMEKAIKGGFKSRSSMDSDTDLAEMRDDPRWKDLMAKLEVNEQAKR